MKLRPWRISRNLTLVELAVKVGVTFNALARYERGERVPRRDIMERIVRATAGRVQPSDFYDFAPPPRQRRNPERRAAS